jgi:hypothetical protein
MTRDSPINIPVIDRETEAGELLEVDDGLVVDPVEVECIEACELLGVVDGLVVGVAEVELVATGEGVAV